MADLHFQYRADTQLRLDLKSQKHELQLKKKEALRKLRDAFQEEEPSFPDHRVFEFVSFVKNRMQSSNDNENHLEHSFASALDDRFDGRLDLAKYVIDMDMEIETVETETATLEDRMQSYQAATKRSATSAALQSVTSTAKRPAKEARPKVPHLKPGHDFVAYDKAAEQVKKDAKVVDVTSHGFHFLGAVATDSSFDDVSGPKWVGVLKQFPELEPFIMGQRTYKRDKKWKNSKSNPFTASPNSKYASIRMIPESDAKDKAEKANKAKADILLVHRHDLALYQGHRISSNHKTVKAAKGKSSVVHLYGRVANTGEKFLRYIGEVQSKSASRKPCPTCASRASSQPQQQQAWAQGDYFVDV